MSRRPHAGRWHPPPPLLLALAYPAPPSLHLFPPIRRLRPSRTHPETGNPLPGRSLPGRLPALLLAMSSSSSSSSSDRRTAPFPPYPEAPVRIGTTADGYAAYESGDAEREDGAACPIDWIPPGGGGYEHLMDDQGCLAYELRDVGGGGGGRVGRGGGGEIRCGTGEGTCVRLQAGPDACLDGIERASDVWDAIEGARVAQGRWGRSDLYPRSWEPVRADGADVGADVCAGANGAAAGAGGGIALTALQFNSLAEGLSSGPRRRLPFGGRGSPASARDDRWYGGFTAVPHPEVALDYDLRRWRLLEVLLGGDVVAAADDGVGGYARGRGSDVGGGGALAFDLIAMEEVDRYHGFFAPVMTRLGYGGAFAPKPRAPGVGLGWYSDGCALFWNRDRFELLREESGRYGGAGAGGNQVYLIASLRHRGSGREMVAAVTHLKAKMGHENERGRTEQARELLRRTYDAAAAVTEGGEFDTSDVPVLIMGDFNSEPGGEGRTCVPTVLGCDRPRLASAYPLRDGSYTTWKTRGYATTRRIIDYIFHNGVNGVDRADGSGEGEGAGAGEGAGRTARARARGFRCTHILRVPDEDEMEPHRLPGLRYPSDHVAIAARFELES